MNIVQDLFLSTLPSLLIKTYQVFSSFLTWFLILHSFWISSVVAYLYISFLQLYSRKKALFSISLLRVPIVGSGNIFDIYIYIYIYILNLRSLSKRKKYKSFLFKVSTYLFQKIYKLFSYTQFLRILNLLCNLCTINVYNLS